LGEVPKQTRGWDESAQVTRGQRSKEESSDYRYFPEPDLAPATTTEAYEGEVRRSLGELPAQLRKRLESTYGISAYDADVLVNQGRDLVDYYIELADLSGDGKQASNWVQQDVLRALNEQGIGIGRFPVSARELAGLLQRVSSGELVTTRARDVLAEMLASGKPLEEAMAALGIAKVDASEIESLCRELLAANPKIVADVKAGKLKAAASLIGQAKRRNPNINAGQFQELCLKLIQEMWASSP
jgi:aspartyl-tRNA(Asn)/glutamyl-tRNA(Gln) amidotransferase subunit B